MHQMRISTTQVSSVVLRLKKLEIQKKIVKKLYKSQKKQILCHEIEPNPSKDRAMHEGDNPSF
jgi:restriction endonuclease S subunit